MVEIIIKYGNKTIVKRRHYLFIRCFRHGFQLKLVTFIKIKFDEKRNYEVHYDDFVNTGVDYDVSCN